MMSFINDLRQAVANLAAPGASRPGAQSYPAQSFPAVPQAAYTPPAYLLREPVNITLDGTGSGTAQITPPGPRNGGLTWTVTGVSVSTATNVLEATASAFLSLGIKTNAPNDFVGNTSKASSGDTCAVPGVQIRPGDWITVVWINGDPGTQATMVINGIVNPPGVGG